MSEEDLAMLEWLRGASYVEVLHAMKETEREIFRDEEEGLPCQEKRLMRMRTMTASGFTK